MDPDTMQLPDHLKTEALALRNAAHSDNPVTEAQARPLMKSTAIWLARNGTVNKEDLPGVIQKTGDLPYRDTHMFSFREMLAVSEG